MQNKNNESYIRIICDGSCLGNPGRGGYGAILQLLKNNSLISEKIIKGCESNTTNNRMELKALIEVLKALKSNATNYKIKVYSDSMYVNNGLTTYRSSWEYRNFRGVKNKELWVNLYKEYDKFKSNIEINYVKAHTSNSSNSEIEKLNNRVDLIARDEAKKCR